MTGHIQYDKTRHTMQFSSNIHSLGGPSEMQKSLPDLRFSKWYCCRHQSPGMWHPVIGCGIPDASKEMVLRLQSHTHKDPVRFWRWRHHIPLKHQELHGVTPQKTCIFISVLLLNSSRLRLKRDGTRAETRFCLSPKQKSPFKSAGASVQSTAGSRGLRISVSNAGYITFWGSVRVLATHSICQFPLHFPSYESLCAIRFQTHSTNM